MRTLLLLSLLLGEGAAPDGMVRIAAGQFWMGQTHIWLRDALEWTDRARIDAQPARLVTLDAFDLDTHEVTNDVYARFVAATGRKAPWHWKAGGVPIGQGRWPVYNVNWADASAYCAWAGKRLPTEAEWERAARGGRERTLYPWGDDFGPKRGGRFGDGRVQEGEKKAQYASPIGPTDVGSFAPNGYGLHDMIGNVWEWTADWYDQNYYATAPATNPPGPDSGIYKVIRGGGWADEERTPTHSVMSNHYRNYTDPEAVTLTIGFRCARSVR